jgi:heme/copper-type cytochrome/quinol oxidase subunit 2
MSTRIREARAIRKADRAQQRARAERRAARIRVLSFSLLLVSVLGTGVWLASADLFGQRGSATGPAAIAVRASMAGFTPRVIEAKAGEPVAIDFWTTDAAIHLAGGVHTFISDELGIYEQLRAESRRTFSFIAPSAPGDYDVYCDTCCGGRDSPTMHGVIRVRA